MSWRHMYIYLLYKMYGTLDICKRFQTRHALPKPLLHCRDRFSELMQHLTTDIQVRY